MKVYLAASWSLKEKMRGVREGLRDGGHQVTSRWIDEPAEQSLKGPDLLADPPQGARHARQDLDDIDAADMVIVFTEVPSTTGGLHAELGYALGTGKQVLICGPVTNVFMCLAEHIDPATLSQIVP